MSKVILVGGKKGGTGKSTVATNLAALRIEKANHENLLLIDTDSQGSTANWAHWRNEKELPGIECIQLFEKRIMSEVKSKIERYSDIIIDAGGRDSKELRYSMIVADVMLIPFGASQHDLSTAPDIDEIIEQAKTVNPDLKCYAFINKLKNHAKLSEGQDAIAFLKEFDSFNTLDYIVHDRISFSRSGGEGQGVNEMKNGKGELADHKAVEELSKIYGVTYDV